MFINTQDVHCRLICRFCLNKVPTQQTNRPFFRVVSCVRLVIRNDDKMLCCLFWTFTRLRTKTRQNISNIYALALKALKRDQRCCAFGIYVALCSWDLAWQSVTKATVEKVHHGGAQENARWGELSTLRVMQLRGSSLQMRRCSCPLFCLHAFFNAPLRGSVSRNLCRLVQNRYA